MEHLKYKSNEFIICWDHANDLKYFDKSLDIFCSIYDYNTCLNCNIILTNNDGTHSYSYPSILFLSSNELLISWFEDDYVRLKGMIMNLKNNYSLS